MTNEALQVDDSLEKVTEQRHTREHLVSKTRKSIDSLSALSLDTLTSLQLEQINAYILPFIKPQP